MGNGFRRRILTFGEEQAFCFILLRFVGLMALVIWETRRLGLLIGFMKRDSLFGRFDSHPRLLVALEVGKIVKFYAYCIRLMGIFKQFLQCVSTVILELMNQ